MTADPSQYPNRAPAWYVHTDQAVILAGPFHDEATARTAGNEVAARLRLEMRRERYDEAYIQSRVRALRVGLGTTEPPHGGFRPCGSRTPEQ